MATAPQASLDVGLHDAHAAARIPNYLAGLWHRRDYVWYVSKNELKSRQMTSVLGNVWHLLNPLLQILVYVFIFGVVLKTDRGTDNYLAFVSVGVFVFGFTQRATTAGATSIVGNRGLLTQIAFPRALLPLTSSVTEALATVGPIIVLYGFAWFSGSSPTWRWLVLPVAFAFQGLFNLGAALVAARATHTVRDVIQILPFIFRLLFFGSGVVFNIEAYTSSERWGWIFYLNPLYGWVTLARWCILGSDFAPEHLVSLLTWTTVLVVGGFLWFRAAEESYGRD